MSRFFAAAALMFLGLELMSGRMHVGCRVVDAGAACGVFIPRDR